MAVLHAGQAVRFGTQELVAAGTALTSCSRPVGDLRQAVEAEVMALRALWPAFAANHPPTAAAVAAVKHRQAEVTAAASAVHMPLTDVSPSTLQIGAG